MEKYNNKLRGVDSIPAIFGSETGKYVCWYCKYETKEKYGKGIREIKEAGGNYNEDFDSVCPSCKKEETLVELP